MEENVPPTTEASPPPPLSAPPPPPPPPLNPPPVIVPPSSSPTPKRGRGWMALALVLLVLLVLSGFYNLSSYFGSLMRGHSNVRYSSARSVGPRLEEVVTEDNSAALKVAVVEVRGIITSQAIGGQDGYGMVEVIKAALRRAEEDNKVRAVLLKVDSPGGEVLASDEIYRAIADFQKHTGKPVVASMGNLAASGGYYVSAPCQWIVANELTITGSIGVIMHGWNYRALMDKVGVLPQVYKSGKFKDMLSGDRDLDKLPAEDRKEEDAMMQALINETYDRFKSVVAAGREQAQKRNKGEGRKLAEDWRDYADGRILSGSEAYKRGFVDQLGNFEDAVERAKRLAGITSANLIEYQQRYDLSDLFRLFGKTESRALKIDLGFDAPKLQVGQLYFLSPTFLH